MGGIVDKRLPGRAFEDKERGIGREPVGGAAASRGAGPARRQMPLIRYSNLPFDAKLLSAGGSLAILPENPSRIYLNIQNQGGSNVYVAFGGPNAGMIIFPSTGFEWAIYAPQNAVYVYTTSGSSSCVLIEGIR